MSASACTPIIGQNTNQAGNVQASPSTQTSPSSAASPSTSTGGNTESPPSTTPSSSPSASPSAAPTKLIITSLAYHVGEVSIGYAPVTAGASGGTPPYKWSIGGGALPAGLSMSTGGTVSGTPTASGTATFVVLLQDSAGQAAGVSRSINVAPKLSVSGPCTKLCVVEAGCVAVCGNYVIPSGGVAAFRYALSGGGLPSPLTLNGPSLAGAFPPPPPQPITTNLPPPYSFTFSVTVTDALGATASITSVYTTVNHIAFGVTTAQCGFSPSSCSITIPYTGGIPGATVTVVQGTVSATINPIVQGPNGATCSAAVATSNPPPGMTTSASGGNMTLAAATDGTTFCGYNGTITFTLVDSDPCGPGVMCTSSNVLTVTFGL